MPRSARCRPRIRRSRCRPSTPPTRRSSRSRSSITKRRRDHTIAATWSRRAPVRLQLLRVHAAAVRRPLLVAVLGPTATGKSALALHLAERHQGEIVSCDSTAIYRGFDIGTDKLPEEERRGIPHHLIDIAEPTRY